jgi:hypothetical protein
LRALTPVAGNGERGAQLLLLLLCVCSCCVCCAFSSVPHETERSEGLVACAPYYEACVSAFGGRKEASTALAHVRERGVNKCARRLRPTTYPYPTHAYPLCSTRRLLESGPRRTQPPRGAEHIMRGLRRSAATYTTTRNARSRHDRMAAAATGEEEEVVGWGQRTRRCSRRFRG